MMHVATTVLGVAILGSLLSASAPPVGAAATGGPIRIFDTISGNGATGAIVITGAIGDYGKTLSIDKNGKIDPNGNFVKVTLKKGAFEIDSTKLNAISNKTQPTMTMATCSAVFSARGPVTLLKGTGKYTGIAGTLNVTLTFAVILPAYTSGAKKGQCKQNNAQPLATYGTVTGSGTVSFG